MPMGGGGGGGREGGRKGGREREGGREGKSRARMALDSKKLKVLRFQILYTRNVQKVTLTLDAPVTEEK